MRKKVIFTLVTLVGLLFSFKVSATTCTYEPIFGGLKENDATSLTDSGADFEYDGQKLLESSFTLPVKYENTPQVTATFDIKGKKRQWKSYPIDNWSSTFGGVNVGIVSYIDKKVCPSYMLLRTGVWEGNWWLDQKAASAYICETESDARVMLNYGLTNKEWQNKSFLFILKLKETSDSGDDDNNNPYTSCRDFLHKTANSISDGCLTNKYYSCLWVKKNVSNGKTVEYCNYDNLTYVRCGDSWDIPDKLPSIFSFIVNLIKILTPIILVFVSVLSIVKAVSSQKEDDLNKAKTTFVKRLIAATLVFFIIQITQFVMFKVAEDSEIGNMSTCFSCLLNNDCSKNRYYRTMIGSEYECTYLNDLDKHYDCDSNVLVSDDS